MITAAQIARYRRRGTESGPTEQLKAELAQARRERHPLYLTQDEFHRILRWKLGRHIALEGNTEEIIRRVTHCALAVRVPEDKGYEVELRMGILCALRGVEVPVASAILALVFPEEYAVIDFRVWRQLFGEEKWSFTISDYKRYMEELRLLAEDLDWPVQEVDQAIWVYDYRVQKLGHRAGLD